MDWQKEAQAVMEDIRPYVSKIHLCKRHKSSEMRIYFKIKSLEQERLVVSMDSSGFTLCNKRTGEPLFREPPPRSRYAQPFPGPSDDQLIEGERQTKTYETINALLDENSHEYRKKFVGALLEKIDFILSDQP